MLKTFFSNKIRISQTLICLVFATLIAIFYNIPLLLQKISIITANGFEINQLAMLILEISLSYFLVFTLLYLFSFSKIIFASILTFFLILSLIATYSINEFNIIITQIVIANSLDNIENFNKIITIKSLIIYCTIFLIAPLILLTKTIITKDKNNHTFFIIIILFLIFVAILIPCKHQKRKGAIFAYPPVAVVHAYSTYHNLYSSFKNRPPLSSINDVVKTKINKQKIQNLKVVLILGESARSKNFSINGYERKNNPRLKKIHNLLSFKDVTPCGTLTLYSVECMLSRKTSSKFELPNNEESIIKVFEKLKFSTSYFSTQKAFGDNNGLVMLASQAQQYYFSDKITNKIGGNMVYDEYLLPDLKQELKRSGDSFIILHSQGSHFLFDDRYTENFNIFKPTCNNKDPHKCTIQQIINSYDNSVAYTDFFIDSVINELKKQNALLIYISDHGQFLGEDGIYYHGPTTSFKSANHKVPMFLWMSNKLMTQKFYRTKFNNAAKRINQPLSHDNLFYSLLDCAGIDANDNDKLSVCQ